MIEATLAMLLGMGPPETSVSVQLVLQLTGDAERRTVTYQCEGAGAPVPVQYVNAEPNFLAILAIEGKQVILVTTLAADGARYVSGPLEWWTHGDEATLTDLRDNGLAPVTCTAMNGTP